MSAPTQPTIIRKKKRRRRRTPIFPFVLAAMVVAGAIWGGRGLVKSWSTVDAANLPEGYIAEAPVLKQEYERYYGSDEAYDEASSHFQSASDLAAKGNLPAVASVLEAASRTAALPVIFHDLGVAYMGLADYRRAAEAFREVLARDPEYAPTRKFVRDARWIAPGAAEPHTREQEPNNNNLEANLIRLRAAVGGEIAGANDMADFYRVSAPPAPRDLMAIEITSHSATFAPQLRVYDGNMKVQNWGDQSARNGKSLKVTGGPAPNSTVYLSISGEEAKGGVYQLTVTPLKAFDRYEPNDEIMAARKIPIGEEVAANIMDDVDKDFFLFTSPRKGSVAVEIRNRGERFAPVLAVYNRNRGNIGFAPDVKPGSDLRHTFDAEKDQTYYLHISAQTGTSGAYILRVD